MKEELLTFSAGYQPTTQDQTKRYFDKVRGTWDGKPRIAYLLPHFMRASSPLTAAWRLSIWMIDYIDKVYTMNTFNHGRIAREHYVLQFCGRNAGFALNLMNQLNPITKQKTAMPINFNSQFYINDLVRLGIITNVRPSVSLSNANSVGLNIYDEMTNFLDNLPVALVQCQKTHMKSDQKGRLDFLNININLTYKRGHDDDIAKNMLRIDSKVRDQLWAEAVYMYDDQKRDEYYSSDGYLVSEQSNPEILYN